MKKGANLSFRRAARWFQKVQPKLLSRHKGDIVAVDPKTGRYFVGDDELDVARQAVSALPGGLSLRAVCYGLWVNVSGTTTN